MQPAQAAISSYVISPPQGFSRAAEMWQDFTFPLLAQVFGRAGTYLVKMSFCFRNKKNKKPSKNKTAVKMKILLLCKLKVKITKQNRK